MVKVGLGTHILLYNFIIGVEYSHYKLTFNDCQRSPSIMQWTDAITWASTEIENKPNTKSSITNASQRHEMREIKYKGIHKSNITA